MASIPATARVLMRHCRNAAQAASGMLLPTRTALELAARCRVTDLDIHLPIPSIFLADMFPEQPPHPANAITLMPGTALNGAPNIFEQFILCALVKKIQPQTILEIGTFKGGTTWHLYQNAPQDATIYTIDLPDNEVPGNVTDLQLAANKRRPFLPSSDRVRQILIDSKKWDGRLDRKVQFAFIDTDHSYEGIRNDTEKTLPLLDSYACICWHDALEKDFGYGTMPYLLELREKGWKIFRLRSSHEISSIAIWMTEPMLERLNVPEPRNGAFLFKYYVGID
jgi:Methyltransferase domain